MRRNLGSHQYKIWNVCDFTRFHDASLFHGIDLPILWMRMNGPFRKIFQLVSMQAPWRICDGLLNKVLRSASHLVKVCNSCIHIYKLYTYTYVYMYIYIYIHTYRDWGSSMDLSGSWYGSTRKSNAQHPGLMSSNDDLQHGLSLTMAPRWAPFSMAMHHVFLQIRQRYHTYEKYWYVLILCIDKYWYVHCQTIINNNKQS